MAKLYKAVDKMDGEMSSFLVAGNEVAITGYMGDKEQISACKKAQVMYMYQDIEAFERRAINPVLIAEW